MSNILHDYVSELTDDEKLSIIAGYAEWRDAGAIGDAPIRIHARAFIAKHNLPDYVITIWMRELAMECHMYYSALYRQVLY